MHCAIPKPMPKLPNFDFDFPKLFQHLLSVIINVSTTVNGTLLAKLTITNGLITYLSILSIPTAR